MPATWDARALDYTSGKPTSKAHANDLIQLLPAHGLLPENHPEGKGQQQHAVPKVTKHDSKEEGKGDNREGGWVGLPVLGHTISIHNLLEGVGDLVGLEVCGWLLICHQGLEDGAHLHLHAIVGGMSWNLTTSAWSNCVV